MQEIGTIYVTWRKGKGSRRKVVGVIKRNATLGVRFQYLKKGVLEAQKEGFAAYVDFPDIEKIYDSNVLDIFGQRLIKTERPDLQRYLDFWDINKKYLDDKYYLLAYTQGILSNDNFEFLADFNPVKGLKFVSELTGLTHAKLPSGTIKVGEKLSWQLEKENNFDDYAVKVTKQDSEMHLGYVKLIHSRIFDKQRSESLQIMVKSIDQNGSINRVFIEISYQEF